MNRLVRKALRYIKLFLLFARINFLWSLEYRVDFLLGFIPSLFYTIGYLFFIGAILGRTPAIVGWNFDQMLLMFATSQLIYYAAWLLYRYSLEDFIDSIRDGSFDFVAKLPINIRFAVSTRWQAPSMIISFLITLGLVIYSLRNIVIDWQGLVLYVFLLVCGFWIYYNIIFFLSTFVFWIVDASDLIWFADDITRFGSYPLKVFPDLLGLVFVSIIPVMLLIYVPVTALLNMLDWRLVAMSLVMVVVTTVVSEKFWQKGLRHYSSASS